MSVVQEVMYSYMEDGPNWVPIPKLSSTIPFGYEQDPDDPTMLLPVPVELFALQKVKVNQYVKRFGLRDTADWLSQATGRRISHVGLRKRLENERRAKSRRNGSGTGASKLRKALEKAEAYEGKVKGLQTLGAKE